MFTRRRFVTALGTCAVVAPLGAFAATAKVHRVGFVAPERALATGPRFEALRAGLNRLGYVEKENMVLEAHWPGKTGEPDHTLRDLTQALIDANADVIVAHGAAAALKIPRALRVQKSPIPLVMATCPDPLKYGVVTSVARPGGNITGLADAPDPAPRQLALLTEAVSGLSRVAVLAHGQFPGHPDIVNSVRVAAQKSGITVLPYTARSPAEFDAAFDEIATARAQAVLVAVDPAVNGAGSHIAALAIKHKLPAVFGDSAHAEAGGLMSYSEDINDTYRRAAVYVDKILKGAHPSTLPIMPADKFVFVINRKTAAALGIKLPATLLGRADRTIG